MSRLSRNTTAERTRRRPRHPLSRRTCSCRKRSYPDHRAAVRALHSAVAARALDPGSCRRERRVYECDLCAGWHATSKPGRA